MWSEDLMRRRSKACGVRTGRRRRIIAVVEEAAEVEGGDGEFRGGGRTERGGAEVTKLSSQLVTMDHAPSGRSKHRCPRVAEGEDGEPPSAARARIAIGHRGLGTGMVGTTTARRCGWRWRSRAC
jgi:hypothetical protein